MLPKTFLAVAMAAAISYSLSAFATDPISNIFCKNNTYGTTSELVTLPSNVGANYYSPDIRFTDENNNPFSDIFDYRAYAGDDLHIQMVLTAQNKIGKISLYRASVHVGRRSGLSQVLATSRGPSLSLKGALENRGLSSNLMAKSSNTLLFAGAAADEFVTYDLVTGKSQSFHLQVNLANPRFSVGADLVIFDLLDSKTFKIKQVAYDLKTSKVVFVTPVSKIDALSMEYNPSRKNWVWLDYDPAIRAATLVESAPAGKKTLAQPEGRLSLPFVYFLDAASNLQVLWTEVVYKTGPYDHGRQPNIFSKAEAKSVSLGADASLVVQWPISKNILDHLEGDLPQRLMSGGFKAPGSNRVFFSLFGARGLLNLDVKTGAWALVAATDSCIDPQPNLQGPPQ